MGWGFHDTLVFDDGRGERCRSSYQCRYGQLRREQRHSSDGHLCYGRGGSERHGQQVRLDAHAHGWLDFLGHIDVHIGHDRHEQPELLVEYHVLARWRGASDDIGHVYDHDHGHGDLLDVRRGRVQRDAQRSVQHDQLHGRGPNVVAGGKDGRDRADLRHGHVQLHWQRDYRFSAEHPADVRNPNGQRAVYSQLHVHDQHWRFSGWSDCRHRHVHGHGVQYDATSDGAILGGPTDGDDHGRSIVYERECRLPRHRRDGGRSAVHRHVDGRLPGQQRHYVRRIRSAVVDEQRVRQRL